MPLRDSQASQSGPPPLPSAFRPYGRRAQTLFESDHIRSHRISAASQSNRVSRSQEQRYSLSARSAISLEDSSTADSHNASNHSLSHSFSIIIFSFLSGVQYRSYISLFNQYTDIVSCDRSIVKFFLIFFLCQPHQSGIQTYSDLPSRYGRQRL